MKEFDILRVNCWMEDIEDQSYETSILITIFEFFIATDNEEILFDSLFGQIKDAFGLKLQYDNCKEIVSHDSSFKTEATDDDFYISLTEEKLEEFRQKQNVYHIDTQIKLFLEIHDLDQNFGQVIKKVLYKAIYTNINSFVTSDIKTLISEKVENNFQPAEIESFNQFLEWEDKAKNKAIYSLFSKSIEFAIITSGRGITEISKDIFTNKTYYLDANIILRGIGIDGDERMESILAVLDSCNHDGINFKIAKSTYDELNNIISKRSGDIVKVSSPEQETFLTEIIEEIPLNNSFETDYIRKRKSGKVKSPNNYKLVLEQELSKFIDRYGLKVEPIKGIVQLEFSKLSKELFTIKKEKYNRRNYKIGSALVDAKNILHVKNVRGANNYNYKDIKSFYLTTDGTLNAIISDRDQTTIAETILPSQLFVIHNSFHKKTEEQDYVDFINFIKLRRTDFKLNGQEVFRYIDQLREVTNDKDDMISCLRGYASYKFKNLDKLKKRTAIQTLKQYSISQLKLELAEIRGGNNKYTSERDKAIKKLEYKLVLAKRISIATEILIVIAAAIVLHFCLSSSNAYISICAIVLFRLILFAFKKDFDINKKVRNIFFSYFAKWSSFYKLYPKDKTYLKEIITLKEKSI